MALEIFNPFENRLCRDIRNDLSETFLDVLEARSITPSEQVAAGFLKKDLPKICRDYILVRLKRYQRVLDTIELHGDELYISAAITWDQKLFFEVHELLEPPWMKAEGAEKLLLQALIRAAGVYLNLELDYTDRARKISLKAIPILEEHHRLLPNTLDADRLISSLKALDPVAPSLLSV